MDDEFDDFEMKPPEHGEVDGEGQFELESDDLLNQVKDPYAKTAWIDDDIYYGDSNIGIVKRIGTADNIRGYINRVITTKGTFNRRASKDDRRDLISLTRSFIGLTDGGGDGMKPLLNNEPGLRIIRGSTFSRGGSIKLGGLTTTLSYNGVDVREINTGKYVMGRPVINKLNSGSSAEVEFSELVADVFRVTSDVMEPVEDKTGVSREVITEVVDEDEDVYTEHTPEIIESMVREKSKHYKAPEPGERIGRFIKDLNNTTIFDGTGNDLVDLPEIPDSVIRDIAESSVSEISERLHERAVELTEQEIREFAGMLDPKGDSDTKIEALDQMADEYRLKALRETDRGRGSCIEISGELLS